MLLLLLALLALLPATTTALLDAVKIIEQIAPKATSCPPPAADPPRECRTASQAAPWIVQSLDHYRVHQTPLMAAVIALMAFESVDFRYKHNVFPGRPGQGTANMQMASNNLLYARQIDALRPQVAAIPSVEGQSDQTLNHILSLVQPDQYNFGSGPWYLMTQCGEDVRRKLLGPDMDHGFAAYMKCVGVEVTDERKAYFERAKKAFELDKVVSC